MRISGEKARGKQERRATHRPLRSTSDTERQPFQQRPPEHRLRDEWDYPREHGRGLVPADGIGPVKEDEGSESAWGSWLSTRRDCSRNTHSTNNFLISNTPGISHISAPPSVFDRSGLSSTSNLKHSPAAFLTPSILSAPNFKTFPTSPWNVTTFSHLLGFGSSRMLMRTDVDPLRQATRIQEPTSPR